MAPFLLHLRSLTRLVNLSDDDMHALVRHYGHIKHLTFAHTVPIPAYHPGLMNEMRRLDFDFKASENRLQGTA
jgi:hypothetical protein